VLNKAVVAQLFKNFPEYYEHLQDSSYHIQKSSTLISILNQIIQFIPHHIFVRSILIISSHLHQGVPSGLVPSDLPTDTMYAFLFPPIRATCLNLDFIILIMDRSISYEGPQHTAFPQ
jgi:hypothetical protein